VFVFGTDLFRIARSLLDEVRPPLKPGVFYTGPSSEMVRNRLVPDGYTCTNRDRSFQGASTHLLTHTGRDVEDIVRVEL
jgi:hypothetical protein